MDAKRRDNSFVKQAAVLAGASMLVRVIGFIYRLPLTDMIGDAGNGIYSKAYAIYNFFLILSSAGLPVAISKLVAEHVSLGRRDEAHRVFRTALAVAAAFGFVCMCVLFFGAGAITDFLGSPRSYHSLLALSPTVFIVAIMSVYRGYFQGLGTTAPTALSQVAEQIFNAVFSLVLANSFMKMISDDPVAMGAAGGTAGTGVGALAGFFAVFFCYQLFKPVIIRDAARKNKTRKTPPGLSNTALAGKILKTSVPIIAGTAVFSITNIIDMSMVTHRLVAGGFTPERAEELFGQLGGKYNVIITLPVSVATALAVAAIPSISASAALKDKTAVKNKIEAAMRITMLICVPAAAGIAVLANPILAMLFPNHPDGGMLLTIGAVNIIFLALNQILTGPLQATGMARIPVIAAAVGGFFKIIVNYFLVSFPPLNIHGAVIGTMFCYVIASAINWTVLCDRNNIRPDIVSVLIKPLISSAVMGAACYVVYNVTQYIIGSNTVSTLVAVFAGVVVYLTYMLLFKGVYKQDLKLVPLGGKIVRLLERRGLI